MVVKGDSWDTPNIFSEISSEMRLAVLFHRFGPYHHARLRAAGHMGDLVGVEFSKVDKTYKWSLVSGADGFRRVTLFDECDIEEMPLSVVSRRMGEVLTEVAPSVVAIPGWSGRGALCALQWCAKQGIPAIVMSETWHDDARRYAFIEAIKSRILRLYSAALVGGTPHAQYLSKLRVPSDRISLGYDAVDNDYFWAGAQAARAEASTLREKNGLPEKYILASSRFVSQKNIPGLLHAYADYARSRKDSAWPLVLLGDGPLRAEIETTAHALGITDLLRLPGFIQYEHLPAYYGLAQLFVHPSNIEPWGLVVNEAMAAGLPILVSRQSGCAIDLVHDGVNGFIFDTEDTRELTGLLLRATSGELDLHAMGLKSRELISLWSADRFGTELWQLAGRSVKEQYLRGSTTILDRLLLKAVTVLR